MQGFVVIFVAISVGAVRSCTTNEECTIAGTTCDDEQCTCEKGYLLSSDGTQCLPYVTEYFADCSEDAQCEWLGTNSHCKFVCRCQEGYRWQSGQCTKYAGLGGTCVEDIDCYDGYNLQSLTCIDSTCSCSTGYYNRDDTDCRKIASSVNATCTLDIDCQVPGTTTVCHIGKCQPPTQFLEDEILEVVEESDSLYIKSDPIICVKDEDCTDISNSYCYDKTGTCICKPQYFFSDDGTTCIAEVGVDVGCATDSDCVLKPGKCEDGVCYCRDYYVTAEGNRECIKTISEENWNCLSNEWCYALGLHSYCSSNGTCQCSKTSEYNSDKKLCKWTGETDPDMCFGDIDCKDIHNAFCVNEYCGCKPGATLQDKRCVPDLGSPCSEAVLCEISNSECRADVCQCEQNYIPFQNKCYLRSDYLNNSCEIDLQCSEGVIYSKCVDKICSCDEYHLPFNNTCVIKTVFGSYCNNRRECSLSLSDMIEGSVMCRNRQCQCETGYTFQDNRCSSGVWTRGNLFIIVSVLLLKGVFSVS